MTFLSSLAAIVAIVLMLFGVNLTELDLDLGEPVAVSTQTPAAPTAEPETTAAPTTEPAATIQPVASAAPVSTIAPVAVPDAWVSQDEVAADVQTIATAVYSSVVNGQDCSMPAFVVDGDGTRLARRWGDYMTARLAMAGDDRPVAFNRPGVTPTFRAMYADGDKLVGTAGCALSLRTQGGAEYAAALTFTLTYEKGDDGARRVTAIRVSGDSDYDALSAAAGEGADAQAIDAAVDAAISNLGAE